MDGRHQQLVGEVVQALARVAHQRRDLAHDDLVVAVVGLGLVVVVALAGRAGHQRDFTTCQ